MSQEEVVLFVLWSIEVFQSLLVAFFLLFLYFKQQKEKSKLLLAITLFSFSLKSIIETAIYFDYLPSGFYFIATALFFITFSFLYAHINSLLINSNKQRVNWIFLVGFLGALFGVVLGVFELTFPEVQVFDLMYNAYSSFLTVFSLAIPFLLIIHMYNHNLLVEKQYSNVGYKKMRFVYYWMLVFFVYLIIVNFVDTETFIQELIDTLISLTITVGLTYNALYHQVPENLFKSDESVVKNEAPKINLEKKKPNTSKLDEALFEQIKQYLVTEKAFLNPDLSLNDLSTQLNSKNQIISQTINHFAKTTFYNFINAYRVAHFKSLILQSKNNEISMDGLIELCGFKSKSTFYSHFKRIEHCTPTQFIERLNS